MRCKLNDVEWVAASALFLAYKFPEESVVFVQRSILYDLKDEIVPPTNETVSQVFARLSAYRDAMDGPQVGSFLLQLSIVQYPCILAY